MIAALAGALLAGALTTLAPCALTLLPVVVGGSLQGAVTSEARRRAVVITAALGASVVVFTLLLRVSTALIDVPPRAWQLVSGSVLVGLGVAATAPELWDRVAIATRLSSATAQGLSRSHQRRGIAGAALTGAALGPVFTSCSPLYAYVVVTVLPAEPAAGWGCSRHTFSGYARSCWPSALWGSGPSDACAGPRTRTQPGAGHSACSS